MVYGLGACLGPLLVGVIMREMQPGTLFIFAAVCAALLVAYVRPERVTGENLSQDAPTHFVPMTEIQTTPVVAEMDPRVDPETDISHNVDPMEEEQDALQNSDDRRMSSSLSREGSSEHRVEQ